MARRKAMRPRSSRPRVRGRGKRGRRPEKIYFQGGYRA